jgi:2-phosphosulfolactate phosphatase
VRRSFVIDFLPECLYRYGPEYAVVAIDVFRATTTANSALALGRRCFPVPTIEAAVELTAKFPEGLLAGELGGTVPYGFDLDNSPVPLQERTDTERPLILLSTSGTRVICGGRPGQTVYAASLRNVSAQVECLVARDPHVALIGAGARGEFRREDALCCARIGAQLLARGYEPEDDATSEVLDRWAEADTGVVATGPSADYLRNTDRVADIDFVLNHVDDIDAYCELLGGELVPAGSPEEIDAWVHRAAE